MPIDLAPHLLLQVREILKEHVPDCEVWVFGSRAQGPAKRFSDLDLALSSTQEISTRRLALLVNAFDESELPFRVDVVDLSVAGPLIREEVFRAGVNLGDATSS